VQRPWTAKPTLADHSSAHTFAATQISVNGIKGPKWFSPSSRPVLFRYPIILPFTTVNVCTSAVLLQPNSFIVAEKLT
jgi:hypothetical protein